MENIYSKYASLREQRDSIEAKLSTVGEAIVSDLLEHNELEADTDNGIFRLRTNKTWKYTKKVEMFSSRLMLMKRTEEVTGKAKVEKSTVSLVYTA